MSRATRTFSRTVSDPKASRRWKVRPMPIRERRCTGVRVTALPLNRTAPLVGRCSPLITLKQVVLPAPLGPIRPVIRPASASNDAWLTAVTPPNWTTTSSTSSRGIVAHLLRGGRRVVGRPWSPCASCAVVGRPGRRSSPAVDGRPAWSAGAARRRRARGPARRRTGRAGRGRLASPLGSRPANTAPTPMMMNIRPPSDVAPDVTRPAAPAAASGRCRRGRRR